MAPLPKDLDMGSALDHGSAGSMKRDPTYFLEFPKTPKMTTSGPNPGSRAQNLGLGQMRLFSVVLGVGYTMVLARTMGGPDMVICSLTPSSLRP